MISSGKQLGKKRVQAVRKRTSEVGGSWYRLSFLEHMCCNVEQI